jgi:hypothetical protein
MILLQPLTSVGTRELLNLLLCHAHGDILLSLLPTRYSQS